MMSRAALRNPGALLIALVFALMATGCSGRLDEARDVSAVDPGLDAGETTADAAADALEDGAPGETATDATSTPEADATIIVDHCPTLKGPAMVPAGSFCIDSTEVSVAEYQAFLADPAKPALPVECGWKSGFDIDTTMPGTGCDNISVAPDMPVVCVDWCDAWAYCRWAGKRLCGRLSGGPITNAEWTDPAQDQWLAACSHNGDRVFPYGNTYDPTMCNGKDSGLTQPRPFPVGPGPCEGGYTGLYDMSGNVNEWEDGCDNATPSRYSECPVRGGSYLDDMHQLRCDSAHYPVTYWRSTPLANTGIRCCWE